MTQLPLALVTGGSRGLGFETARQLGRLGYRLILASRTPACLAEAARSLRAEGRLVSEKPFDLADPDSIAALAQWLGTEFPPLDVLINCAGVMPEAGDAHTSESRLTSSVLDTDERRALDTIDVNMIGTWRLTRAVAPLLARNARIVNVSSSMASLTAMGPGYFGYRVSKAGLNVLTRLLAYELRTRGILVNCVCPGWVKTAMGGPGAIRDVAEGAAGIVWAATLPADGPSGGFFQDGKPYPW
jgi:NAD(P)-dependent dehydrogenase (short-subunit alcohol dehydrogenase family)